MPGVTEVSRPKEFRIPSRSYGIVASEAADILVTAKEIKKNKPLYKAAISQLKSKQKFISEAIVT